MPSIESVAVAAAQATDLSDLLEHIAWTDILKPKMLQYKNALVAQLTASLLGRPITSRTAGGMEVLVSKEQLAGQIAGIDWLVATIESILRKGGDASEVLESSGFHLTATN